MTELALRLRTAARPVPAAVAAAVLSAAAVAWLVLIGRMAGMDMGPGGDPGTAVWFAGTWALMTAAMMFPASLPAVIRRVQDRSAPAPAAAALFLAGYCAVWMLAGLAGYGLVQAVRGLHTDVLSWSAAGRYATGAAVAAAGLYQLTPANRRWLARCVTPARAARPGARGALLAGAEHGRCCAACCWTLMAALYALGMMNLTWMAILTVLIAAERLLPSRSLAVPTIAVLLVMLGIGIAVSPASVPGLTIPAKSQPSMTGMTGMPQR